MSLNGTGNVEQAVERLLGQTPEGRTFDLHVIGSRTEDKWVHIVVAPRKEGIRAYEFAELLAKVEAKVREEQHRQEILLVPARF